MCGFDQKPRLTAIDFDTVLGTDQKSFPMRIKYNDYIKVHISKVDLVMYNFFVMQISKTLSHFKFSFSYWVLILR